MNLLAIIPKKTNKHLSGEDIIKYLLCKVEELAQKAGKTKKTPENTTILREVKFSSKKPVFVFESLHIIPGMFLNGHQELALKVARRVRLARRQPALHQEGTGRHDDIFIHSGSFLPWLQANLRILLHITQAGAARQLYS